MNPLPIFLLGLSVFFAMLSGAEKHWPPGLFFLVLAVACQLAGIGLLFGAK